MARRKTERRRKGKPSAEPLEVSTYMLVVPPWKSPAEVLEYLEHDVSDWLTAVGDLVDSGVAVEVMVLEDLARIVKAIAAYLREPCPVEAHSEAFEYLDDLTRMIRELYEKSELGI